MFFRYVYHPDYSQCFSLYRKGPCENGKHLVLDGTSKVPQCIKNFCKKDNEVLFRVGLDNKLCIS